jgi:hypothetical protein
MPAGIDLKHATLIFKPVNSERLEPEETHWQTDSDPGSFLNMPMDTANTDSESMRAGNLNDVLEFGYMKCKFPSFLR